MNSPVWHKSGQGIYESDVRIIFVNPMDDKIIYAGTSKALYKSINTGKSYRAVLRPSGEQKRVNDIYIPPDQPATVYAATDAGLYESLNEGKTWNRIYDSSDARLRKCLSVIRHSHVIYLGTQKGLLRKTVQETSWRKIKEGFDDKPVYHIVDDDDFLYLATGQTLFSLDKKTLKIQKIFSSGIGEKRTTNDEWELFPSGESDEENQNIKFLQVVRPPQTHLFVASSQGIYFSPNQGATWKRFSTDNLAFKDLTSLLILENNTTGHGECPKASFECLELLAGTKKGVFFFTHGKWMPIYRGMETNEISHLAKDMRRTVYAATTKGIFYLPVGKTLPSNKVQEISPINIGEYYRQEPTINEVHQLVIDYAEVNREKIINWRRQARRKAWLPDLDIGVDSDRDWSSSDSIWGSYSSGGQHYIGPDDKTRGEDFGWDVSLSWDLGDLVWSTDQTTIDSRSKLMVELREDILNEVTRLYFERRRIQIELGLGDISEFQMKIDKKMRIDELTALIDALTGGGFSKKIAERGGGPSPASRDSKKGKK